MVTVTVCVGSSCHIKGARSVITRFNDLLKERRLGGKVELKGSFCMERCGEGVNWQINDEPLSSAGVEDAVRTFISRIVEPVERGLEVRTQKPMKEKKKDGTS